MSSTLDQTTTTTEASSAPRSDPAGRGWVLAGLGADHDDVVKINNYYVGGGVFEDWEAAARIRARYFTEPGPAAELPGPADESLGASLIASGIVPKPAAPKVDPLAPIRRMSQAEKIAFFS